MFDNVRETYFHQNLGAVELAHSVYESYLPSTLIGKARPSYEMN